MRTDVDLVRRVALELETLERSPPEAIILDLDEFSGRLGRERAEVEEALERLAELALIEGPGRLNDAWLFRRVTVKGLVFVDEVRGVRRWERIKRAYGSQIE